MKLVSQKGVFDFHANEVEIRPPYDHKKSEQYSMSVPDGNGFPLFMLSMTAHDKVCIAKKLLEGTGYAVGQTQKP